MFGTMKSSQKSQISSNSKSIYSSSFKQVIRGVESLIEDDDEAEVSLFAYSTPAKMPSKTPTKIKKQGITNGQKLQALMKNEQLREKISQHLTSNGYFDIFPILKVQFRSAIGGPTEFPAGEQELTEVFKRFQNLERVMVFGSNIYVFFNDHLSAYFAEKTMNDLTFRMADVKLSLKWCQPHEYFEISPFLNFERNCPLPQLTRTNSTSTPKFTCRFKIQIENQKEFQVARRIIGPKGNNMKKIIDTCSLQVGADPNVQSDSIKLRLRGKGSGYKEGPNKAESDDPLHLCISCKQEKAYNKACELVEALLIKVYEQYRGFCLRIGRKIELYECVKMDSKTNQSPTGSNCSSNSRNSFYNFDQYDCSTDLSQSEIRMYIQARNKARRELNFMQADRIRSFLKNKGVILMDQKGGRGRGVQVTTWKLSRM